MNDERDQTEYKQRHVAIKSPVNGKQTLPTEEDK